MPSNYEDLRLIQDNDGHWYVIPVSREEDFANWVLAQERCKPWTRKWEPERVDGPHAVTFQAWEERT